MMMSLEKKFFRHAVLTGLFILLAAGIWQSQKAIDSIKRPEAEEYLLYFPSGRYLSVASLGYDQLLADLLWIKTTTYFATHLITDKNYPWLYKMLDVITSLDKDFHYVYYFGGIVLSLDGNQPEKSNLILAKGMGAFPDEWLFPFYIGFNYYYHLNDPQMAAVYMQLAASHKEAPGYVKSFTASLYGKLGKKEQSLAFLENLYENSDDEMLKARIRDKIQALRDKEE